jgi:hypothetical protein
LVTGSFNWSKTAANDNNENLFVVNANNPANRTMMSSYLREFVAFFNHPDTLTMQQAKSFKRDAFNALQIANGEPASPRIEPGQPLPIYVPPLAPDIVDVNHLSDGNYDRLADLIGDRSTLRALLHHSATYGPYTGFENLLERVPKIGTLPQPRIERMMAMMAWRSTAPPPARWRERSRSAARWRRRSWRRASAWVTSSRSPSCATSPA